MRPTLNVWVIRRDGTTSESHTTVSYIISRDYLTAEKSSFEILEDVEFQNGDLLMAKFQEGKGVAFFGIIDSSENNKIVCNDLFTIVNFEFPATRITGDSFENHARNLITRYLVQDVNKLMDILDINVMSNTKHIYQPAEPPTPTNLMKYLINGFKKYNVVWSMDGISNGRIKSTLNACTETIQLKDNVTSFENWDISTTEVGKGVENHLLIINKNTTNSEGPNILSQWWLTRDNEVVSNVNHPSIIKPTKTKVWVYDTTEEDKPAYEDIANSELKGGYYSHEITVDIPIDSEIIQFELLTIGRLATIVHKETTYQSVLTGYALSNESQAITLRFGHIRSRLSELLE